MVLALKILLIAAEFKEELETTTAVQYSLY